MPGIAAGLAPPIALTGTDLFVTARSDPIPPATLSIGLRAQLAPFALLGASSSGTTTSVRIDRIDTERCISEPTLARRPPLWENPKAGARSRADGTHP